MKTITYNKLINPLFCPLLVFLAMIMTFDYGLKAAEQAGKADDFVDHMGICIHPPSWTTRYTGIYSNTNLIQSKLALLGIRYYRIDATDTDSDWNFYNSLYRANGLKANVLFSYDFGNIETRLQTCKAVLSSVEGPNEEDAPGSSWVYRSAGFPTGATNLENDLYKLIQNNPVLQSVPVIVPSLTNPTNSTKLAGCLGDYENMHSYPGNFYPVWELDSPFIAYANTIFTPSKPLIATETGYQTALLSVNGAIDERCMGKYIPRIFAEYWNRNVARTYTYELIDEGVDQTDPEQCFGLLHNDGTPKAPFTAEKNMIALLSEPGVNFVPGSLDYSLTGTVTNVDHTLLQKSNGDFFLLLWQEGLKSFSNIGGAHDITNADVAVTLNLVTAISSAVIYRYDDSGNLTTNTASIVNNTISLSVPDAVLYVKLVTGSALSKLASPVPAGLTATVGNTQTILSWAASPGATGYNVKRATVSGGPYTTIAAGVVPTLYTNTGLVNGTTYFYVVSATNSAVESANSVETNVTPAALATVIVDNADATGVTVTGAWTAGSTTVGYYATNYLHDGNTGATGGKNVRLSPNLTATAYYNVLVRYPAELNRANNTPVDVIYAGGTNTSSVNQQTGCFGGTWVPLGAGTFNFNAGTAGNVLIRNDGANGYVMADAVKFVQVAPPNAPTGLAANTASSSQIDLSWAASIGATSYDVKRSTTSGGPYTTIATGVASTGYSDTGLSSGTTYYYVVSAVNNGGEGSNSAQTGATTVAATPTGLIAMAGNTRIILSWTASGGATSYKVKRATTSGGPYTTIASPATTGYTNTGLANGTAYYYVVSSVDAGGESANSSQVTATPQSITIIKDNSDSSGITINGSWPASTTNPGYYGTNYLHDNDAGGGKSVKFTPTITVTGYYDVYARWTSYSNRATNAPIDVNYAGGTSTFSENQQTNNGTWMWLGTFQFNAGTGGNVTVRDDGANGYVIADAAEFILK